MNKVLNLLFCIAFLKLSLFAELQHYVCDSLDLVTYSRIDIMAKYIYAKYRELGVQSSWPLELYSQHHKVWGNFIEYGGKGQPPQKVGLPQFLDEFHMLLDSVKEDGFDENKSVVPVGKYGILNGAHRVTACLLYDKPVICSKFNKKQYLKFRYNKKRHKKKSRDRCEKEDAQYVDLGVDLKKGIFDYKFFQRREKFVPGGLHEKYLDAMALQYCGLKKDSCLMLVFNSSKLDELSYFIEKFAHIVYKKDFLGNKVFLNNFASLMNGIKIYDDVKNDFESYLPQINKLKHLGLTVFLLDFDYVEFKNILMRKMHSLSDAQNILYISQSHEESLILAQSFFVKNSLDVLSGVQFKNYDNLNSRINYLKKFIKEKSLDIDLFCVVGDLFNESPDKCEIRFLQHGYDNLFKNYDIFELNLKGKIDFRRDELIVNPKYFFYYRGLKFLTLNVWDNFLNYCNLSGGENKIRIDCLKVS